MLDCMMFVFFCLILLRGLVPQQHYCIFSWYYIRFLSKITKVGKTDAMIGVDQFPQFIS